MNNYFKPLYGHSQFFCLHFLSSPSWQVLNPGLNHRSFYLLSSCRENRSTIKASHSIAPALFGSLVLLSTAFYVSKQPHAPHSMQHLFQSPQVLQAHQPITTFILNHHRGKSRRAGDTTHSFICEFIKQIWMPNMCQVLF